jgi:hypothetical protein
MYDVQAGGTNSQQVAAHDAPVKCVEFTEVNGTQVLVTAGWDKKLKVGWGLMRGDRPDTTVLTVAVLGHADAKPYRPGGPEREGILDEHGPEAAGGYSEPVLDSPLRSWRRRIAKSTSSTWIPQW